jgi:hypothetical protein
MHIVRPAAQLQIRRGRLTACRKRHDVMELQEFALRAAAVRAGERASTFITSPDFPSDCRRDVALYQK